MPRCGTVGLAHAIVWPVPAARKEFPKEDWQNWQQGRFKSDRFPSPFTRHSLRTTLSPKSKIALKGTRTLKIQPFSTETMIVWKYHASIGQWFIDWANFKKNYQPGKINGISPTKLPPWGFLSLCWIVFNDKKRPLEIEGFLPMGSWLESGPHRKNLGPKNPPPDLWLGKSGPQKKTNFGGSAGGSGSK